MVVDFLVWPTFFKTGINSNKRAHAILLVVCFLKAWAVLGSSLILLQPLVPGTGKSSDNLLEDFLKEQMSLGLGSLTSSLTFENCWWKG